MPLIKKKITTQDYLKYYYKVEFWCALLNSYLANKAKMDSYIGSIKMTGIKILPPDINRSTASFEAQDGGIRFGLLAVRNLGRNMIDVIVRERQVGGNFTSFYDFCRRMTPYRGWNSRALESLIRCGALDRLDANRRQMLQVYLPWSE